MNRHFLFALVVVLVFVFTMPIAVADDGIKSGAFTFRIKGNGTAIITNFDYAGFPDSWSNEGKEGKDIFIPRMLDGYTVTEIGERAFSASAFDEYGLSYLIGNIVIPDTITTIGEKAFMSLTVSSKVISIPGSVQHIGAGAFSNMSGVEQFTVDAQNPVYATIDGVLFNKKQKSLIAYPGSKKGTDGTNSYSIPNGIIEVADYAFYGITLGTGYNSKASCIQLPETLKSIGAYSFAYAGITTHTNDGYRLELPSSVSSIGEGAFFHARSGAQKKFSTIPYQEVDLSKTSIREIPDNAFRGCSLLGSVTLPETLEIIGEYAFAELNDSANTYTHERALVSITIPAAVKEIKTGAFSSVEKSKIAVYQPYTFAENSQLTKIGDEAFKNAPIKGEIVLPDGLKTLGNHVFFECVGLERIVIPASVTSIGEELCARRNVYIEVESGSYAALWASENGYITQQAGQEDTSWLN